MSTDMPQVPAMPRQPFDVDEFVPLPDLVEAADRHEWAVVAAACGVERRPGREVAEHALAALALGEAVRIRIELARGALIRDALAHGATLDEIAAALNAGPQEAVDDVECWADVQLSIGAMDRAGRARVAALVERAGGGGR